MLLRCFLYQGFSGLIFISIVVLELSVLGGLITSPPSPGFLLNLYVYPCSYFYMYIQGLITLAFSYVLTLNSPVHQVEMLCLASYLYE